MKIGVYCWNDLEKPLEPFLATVKRLKGRAARLYCYASQLAVWPAHEFLRHVRPYLEAVLKAKIEPWLWYCPTMLPARPETLASRRDRLMIVGDNRKWPLEHYPHVGSQTEGTGVGTPGRVPAECLSHPEVRNFLIERLALTMHSLPFAGLMAEEPDAYQIYYDGNPREVSDCYCWCPRCRAYTAEFYTEPRKQYMSDLTTAVLRGVRQLLSKPVLANGSWDFGSDWPRGRDWGRWCREDLIDGYSPQTYDATFDGFRAKLQATVDHLHRQTAAGHVESPRPILACHVGTPDEVLQQQVAYCRTLGLDFDLFHSDALKDNQLNIILEAAA